MRNEEEMGIGIPKTVGLIKGYTRGSVQEVVQTVNLVNDCLKAHLPLIHYIRYDIINIIKINYVYIHVLWVGKDMSLT